MDNPESTGSGAGSRSDAAASEGAGPAASDGTAAGDAASAGATDDVGASRLDADDRLPEDDELLEAEALPDYDELDDEAALASNMDTWRAGAGWARLSVTLGLGLAGVQALYLIFTFAQGLAVRRSGAGSLPGDALHRIGIAFSRSLSPIQGLALVLAVALVSLPSIVDMPLSSRFERRRIVTLWAVAVLAVVIGIGNALGVRAELHLDQVQGTGTTPFRRWALATDVVGTLGTALLAFLAALAAFPEHRRGQPRS